MKKELRCSKVIALLMLLLGSSCAGAGRVSGVGSHTRGGNEHQKLLPVTGDFHGSSDILDVEKRLVYSGPNPLHNRR